MIEATAIKMAQSFPEFLGKVEQGETVRITKNGRLVARLVPETGFMSGKAAAGVFESYQAGAEDLAAADAIALEIKKLDEEAARALDH